MYNDNIVAIWTSPRSVSTALYKSFLQRENTKGCYEPYNDCFYFSEERRSTKYGDTEESRHKNSAFTFSEIQEEAKTCELLVVKDMAFMANPYISDEELLSLRNVFLVRNPTRSLRSIRKVKPDFDEVDFGYNDLGEMYKRLSALSDTPPPVVVSETLIANPEGTLRRLCDTLKLPFESRMLSWEAGHIRHFEPYEYESHTRWHTTLAETTGFAEQTAEKAVMDLADLSSFESKVLEKALPIYDEIAAHAI
jgi:hypothetical protein